MPSRRRADLDMPSRSRGRSDLDVINQRRCHPGVDDQSSSPSSPISPPSSKKMGEMHFSFFLDPYLYLYLCQGVSFFLIFTQYNDLGLSTLPTFANLLKVGATTALFFELGCGNCCWRERCCSLRARTLTRRGGCGCPSRTLSAPEQDVYLPAALSRKTVHLQTLGYLFRCVNTVFAGYSGYVPVDATGDWLYQFLDFLVFLLSCFTCWRLHTLLGGGRGVVGGTRVGSGRGGGRRAQFLRQQHPLGSGAHHGSLGAKHFFEKNDEGSPSLWKYIVFTFLICCNKTFAYRLRDSCEYPSPLPPTLFPLLSPPPIPSSSPLPP